jgi:type II secretory ATPase GspE/PulE/Tfp pilus assembly ATPase PilB-like protein
MPPKKIKNNFNISLTKELSKHFPQYEEKLETFPSRKLLDSDLSSRGVLSEAELIAAYAKATGLPVLEEEEIQSPEQIPGIPVDFLTYKGCLPLKKEDNVVEIAVSDPYSIDEIKYTFNNIHSLKAKFFLIRRTYLERVIQSVYLDQDTPQDDDMDITFTGDMDSEEALRSLASEAKIVRLVNDMFSRAVEMEASDIHVEPDEKKLSIRFRVDGKLYEAMTPSLSLYPAIASRIKLVGGLNIAERRLPQDGRTDLQIGKSLIDVRISTIPTMNGESIVLRVLNKNAIVFDLKNIGMRDRIRGEFEKLIKLPYGIILVVGPTGSGKSTTLYSVISKINTADRKIITIEDPVEYRTEGIQQIQVNSKIGLDFASGLRHVVRQDPDVILVGEIRDKETAEIAIHAALTGHLVFSTLHTNDAPGAVSRLLDMGIENFLVSSSLSGVLSQRLVRKICPTCKATGKTTTGVKCKTCNGRGFKGRIGIFELMTINDEIRDCINNGDDSAKIAKVAMRHGMRPLIEDGKEKVKEGVTTESEIAGVSFDSL